MMEELAQIRELLTRGLLKTSPAGGASVAGGAGETGNAIDCVASVALDLMKIKSR